MWHARPLTDDDLESVVAMVNVCELADSGEVLLEQADLVSHLAHLNRERDAVVVVQNGRIVGWGMVWDTRKRWADVHPDARGQGIGEWLLRWSSWRAAALGADRIGQTIDDQRTDVGEWLVGHGYTPRYTSWVLAAPAQAHEHAARPAAAEEVDTVLDLFEEAFAEHADRLPVSREHWRSATVDRPGSVAEDLLVVDVDDQPAAAAFLVDAGGIWVDKLAVAPAHRGRGLARELLRAAADRAAARGYPRIRLSTDSNTSALAVYQGLGMSVERSYTHWALDL